MSLIIAGNVVMVATSNTAPRDLYRDGLNRQLFTPFIKMIEARMETHELESAKDYRLEKLHGSDFYLTPAEAHAEAAMDASFRKLTGRTRGEKQTLRHKGHSIVVPQAHLAWRASVLPISARRHLGPSTISASRTAFTR